MNRTAHFVAGAVAMAIVVAAMKFMEPRQAVGEEKAVEAPKDIGIRIATFDFWLMFGQHPKYKSLRDLRTEFDTATKTVEAELKRLDDLPKSAADTEAIAKQQMALKLKLDQQKSEFERKEVEIINAIRTDIDKLLSAYCKKHKIDVVIKSNHSGERYPTDRNEVMRWLGEPVIYDSGRIDITESAIQEYWGDGSQQSEEDSNSKPKAKAE